MQIWSISILIYLAGAVATCLLRYHVIFFRYQIYIETAIAKKKINCYCAEPPWSMHNIAYIINTNKLWTFFALT